jgi:hypothetical protein
MTPGRWRAAAPGIDVVAVVLFVVIGRAAHHHGETVAGFASTAWPFAVGLGAGWALVVAMGRRQIGIVRRASPASLAAGGAVCVCTVAIGMALRVVAGQGTAPAFIAVATGFLGAVMLGGRVVLDTAARLARSRP